MVRDAAPFLGRQLGGTDVHPPVELHRVGVDDLAAQALGQMDAEIGLSRRGGTDDGDDPRGGAGLLTATVSQTSGPLLERAT